MSDGGGASLTVVQPGEGREGSLGSIGVVFKLGGERTGGRLSIVEHPFPVGAMVPPHLHTREDEISIVTEGTIGFRSGDEEVVLGRGGYIVKPRNELHAMWNAGDTPARIIELISPAGFDGFFAGLADLLDGGAALDPARVGSLAEDYGLRFPEASWLPDVVTRYHLTPPPRPEQS